MKTKQECEYCGEEIDPDTTKKVCKSCLNRLQDAGITIRSLQSKFAEDNFPEDVGLRIDDALETVNETINAEVQRVS